MPGCCICCIVIGIVTFVAGIAVVVLAVGALVWALRVLSRGESAQMAYVVIAICFGLAGGIVGKIKGSSFWLWFLISGLVPVLGLWRAIAYRFERDELRRQCPRCGRVTKIYDAICTRCGTELEFPDVAIAPESWEPRRAER